MSWYGADDASVSRQTSDEDFDRASSGFEEPGNGAYFIEHGRVYNNTSWAYRFPADQEEVLRLDRQHYVMLHSLPGLYRGPVDEILNDQSRLRRVLDIGCGTGIWLAEMAERFPHVDCVGVDLMNLQHSHHLRNCTYMCVEAPAGLDVFPNRSFDIVQVRQMMYSLDDFPETLRQAYRILRPGGVVLVYEPQCQFYSSYEGYTAADLAPKLCQDIDGQGMGMVRRGLTHRGIDLTAFDNMEDLLERAGFDRSVIDVFFHYRQIAPCDDSDAIALNESANTTSFVSAARLIVLEAGEATADEYDAVEREVGDEVAGRSTGSAGPLGGRGVISPWGYWWVRKNA